MTSEKKVLAPSGKNTRTSQGKSKWPKTPAKWIKLLSTPITLLIAVIGLIWGVYQFNAQQESSQQQMLAQQKAEFSNLQEQEHQTTFQTYIDRMSDLLTMQNLATSKINDVVRAIAKARTFRALANEDSNRKGSIISFLWEAQLINGPDPIISLNTANLVSANMQNSYLNSINLRGALVSYADLYYSDLDGANLTNAHLDHVDFRSATLRNADLKGADLKGALFDTNTILTGAIMPDGTKHP